MGKRIVVILGMHRSGTSILSRGLQVMGVELGDNLIKSAGDNQKGFWEDADIVAINDEILEFIGNSWDSILPIESSTLPLLKQRGYYDRALELLNSKTERHPCFGFKDPRTAKLLFFWKEILSNSDFDTRYLMSIRNPKSVVLSLAKRNGLRVDISYALWLSYTTSMMYEIQNVPYLIVDYDLLLEAPVRELNRVAKHIGLAVNEEKLQHYLSDFLDTNYRHNMVYLDDLAADDQCPAIVKYIYEHLLYSASNIHSLVEPNVLNSEESNICYSHQLLHQALCWQAKSLSDQYIDKIAQLKYALSKETMEKNALSDLIIVMRKTVFWQLIVPLRFIKNMFTNETPVTKHKIRQITRSILGLIPDCIKTAILSLPNWVKSVSSQNQPAVNAIIQSRLKATHEAPLTNPLTALADNDQLPCVDISVVTHNSSEWIEDFTTSLLQSDYPMKQLRIIFVDNASTDNTVELLEPAARILRAHGVVVSILQEENNGYGYGHDTAIKRGTADLCLITNIDLTFNPDALRRVVSTAINDEPYVAAWELRQTPYEHPKFYDPVTGLTNWNSHACVLIRRSAYESVGGYDRNIFIYSEDVELSYRFRNAGYSLKYCPRATVNHHSRDDITGVKPLQYEGTIFASLYLRMKYGNWLDKTSVIFLALRALLMRPPYPKARQAAFRALSKFLRMAPSTMSFSKNNNKYFPFRGWDYEMVRNDADVHTIVSGEETPLVSVITRSINGRETLLRQALLSVAHQTYPNIEHLVVEDGGEHLKKIVDEISRITGRQIQYFSPGKLGRSGVGNTGLAAARGKWCVFLDDDDLLFADHVETLITALNESPDSAAAYSMNWAVNTFFTTPDKKTYEERLHLTLPETNMPFSAERLATFNFIPIQSILFKRSLYLERGGFDTDIDGFEDWVLWNRYAQNNSFIFVPKVTSMYRVPVSRELQTERQRIFDSSLAMAQARINTIVNSKLNKDNDST